MKNYEVLRKAAELISTKGWSQGAAARNVGGIAVSPVEDRKVNDRAATYSMYGAVAAAIIAEPDRIENIPAMWAALEKAVLGRGVIRGLHPVIQFNDVPGQLQSTIEEVLAEAADSLEKSDKAAETMISGGAA